MLQISYSRPWSFSLSDKDLIETTQYEPSRLTSTSFKINIPKKISFPDPPRPPTPGPPPRPPPIPPRPPVPTPPPSPNSSTEMEWLEELVTKQLSIIAVRLLDVWFTPGGPVSLPQPPRPPTPGPRPGPIGPRPDVPTPPPSPRRRLASGKNLESNYSNVDIKVSDLGTTLLGQVLYEHLAFQPYMFTSLLKMTQSPYDSREEANMDNEGELYDNKLTDCPDDPSETRLLRAAIFNLAPKQVSDPHMSYLDSYTANESYSSNQTLYIGTGTLRNDSGHFQAPSLGQLAKTRPDSFDIFQGLSNMAITSAITDVPARTDRQGLSSQTPPTPKTAPVLAVLGRQHAYPSHGSSAPAGIATPFDGVGLIDRPASSRELGWAVCF
ncbi:uncharacterized protein F4822DRAFT_441489 [Hypoxylon trugodes]|uniref:uncharacterized protein n=1 Tax=Hypoxylon trugodes TaxID=326681 RepID=UPI0021995DE5|nr:uncharacterized protein F4822DRAFT_441489 [Hypoxylon trugodes]KAI1392613.1 hypothetical protein F4822DRAFT_441489 [Hypoxylon trugodes]